MHLMHFCMTQGPQGVQRTCHAIPALSIDYTQLPYDTSAHCQNANEIEMHRMQL